MSSRSCSESVEFFFILITKHFCCCQDEILRLLVQEFGSNSWSAVALHFEVSGFRFRC